MSIIFKQSPMTPRKKRRSCSRCQREILSGEDYNLAKQAVVCNDCVNEDEYISRIKLYKGASEKFTYGGIMWDISAILRDIERGREFKRISIPLSQLTNINYEIIINQDIIDKVDEHKPGIIAEVGANKIIIDGHHRIEKGLRKRIANMEFLILTFKEHFEYIIHPTGKELEQYLEETLKRI